MWPGNTMIHPDSESPWVNNKHLWRYIIRPLLDVEGSPNEVNRDHLEDLLGIRESILQGNYDREASIYSKERGPTVIDCGFKGKELLPVLNTLIRKIERLGYAIVLE